MAPVTVTESVTHLRDARRQLGTYPGESKPAQVPVICALDLIPLRSSHYTAFPEKVTCPDCRERIDAGRSTR